MAWALAGRCSPGGNGPALRFAHGFFDYPYEAFAHLENPDLVARRLRGE